MPSDGWGLQRQSGFLRWRGGIVGLAWMLEKVYIEPVACAPCFLLQRPLGTDTSSICGVDIILTLVASLFESIRCIPR